LDSCYDNTARQIEGVRESGAEENLRTSKRVPEKWRKLHNEKLQNLYSSLSNVEAIKRIKMRSEASGGNAKFKQCSHLFGNPQGS
jgi:hypothetical protein